MILKNRSKSFYLQGLIKRGLLLRIFIGVIVLLLFFLILATHKQIIKYSEIKRELASAKDSIQKIEAENNKFSQNLDSLNQESFIEREAKLKLNLKKPGEKVAVIIMEEDPSAQNNKERDIFKNIWEWWKGMLE